jgi:small-conductance mechanosensitive channel
VIAKEEIMTAHSLSTWQEWLTSAGILVVSLAAAHFAHILFFKAVRKLSKRTTTMIDDSIVRRAKPPAKLIFLLVGISVAMPFVDFPAAISSGIFRVVGIGFIVGVSWLAIAFIGFIADVVAAKYDVNVKDNLTARRVNTQVDVLRRIAIVIIAIVGLSAILMTFPEIRGIGAGIFASAGIAGLVIGMAARPTLSNLIAGVQLALTEPIRIDDVVIVEGEWGWIEEIRPTYVVVRIWDLRRLVVPLTYFMEKPFQNWTRQSADLLGTVFLYADYSVPVDSVRNELHRILQASKRWDGKAWGLQVTNASEQTVEMRALMSAPDSGTAWDLRCEVREQLINFLQKNYPDSLPRARAEIIAGGSQKKHGQSGEASEPSPVV